MELNFEPLLQRHPDKPEVKELAGQGAHWFVKVFEPYPDMHAHDPFD